MKPKLLIAASILSCLRLAAQNTTSQHPLLQESNQWLTQTYLQQHDYPDTYAWYDTSQHRIVYSNEYIRNTTTAVPTGKALTNTFHLVKDINTATDANPTNFDFSAYGTQQFAVLNNTVYYSTDDGIHGTELWKSDGTTAGTVMVKDINKGTASSSPDNIVAANGKLYFSAQTPDYGIEIWVSDGTAAGTKILKDITPGSLSSFPEDLCAVNGNVFFLTAPGLTEQLWKTDGTTAGTVMVTDLSAINCSDAIQLVSAHNLLFFTGTNTSFYRTCLWRSDGTAAGTFMVKDDNFQFFGITHLTAYKNKLYFTANNGFNQYLWVSDGTTTGTGYAPGYNSVKITSGGLFPEPFVVAGNSMYFAGYTSTYGNELYRYNENDGLGVVLVKDINADGYNTYIDDNSMASVNNTLYFVFSENGAIQLWKTKGSSANTAKVTDLNDVTDLNNFYSDSSNFYFSAHTANAGYEPWRSDGTANNTGILKEIYTGRTSSDPLYFTRCNNKVVFAAANAATGTELWQTDGTSTNTTIIKNINKTTTASSGPFSLTTFNNTVIFRASTWVTGNEPFVSDGTSAGTHIIKDINPGEANSYPIDFEVKNNYAYFIAKDSIGNTGIFRTDGSDINTIELANFSSYNYYFTYDYCITDNGFLFYILQNNNTHLYELWKTNGSALPVLVKSNFGYSYSSLTAMGTKVYFTASEPNSLYGYELWQSGGTLSNTVMLKDIFTGPSGSYPHDLYAYNGTLYFGANNGTEDELWKSNGTSGGTKKVKAIYPAYFKASGTLVYFSGNNSAYGNELWETDGTPAGTKLVKNIMPGNSGSDPTLFTDVNGTLFFVADDGTHGQELWNTNGTTATTKLVKDIIPGIEGSVYNFGYTAVADLKLFFAYDSVNTTKLWVSDGTDTGTYAVNDEGLAGLGLGLGQIAGNGNKLFLSGSNYTYGSELYMGDASVISDLKKTNAATANAVENTLSAHVEANPFSNQIRIDVSSPFKQKVNIIVSDALGNVYYSNVLEVQPGTVNCTINTPTWRSGVYIIKISGAQANTNVVTLKALK